jgi:hypothetical protein
MLARIDGDRAVGRRVAHRVIHQIADGDRHQRRIATRDQRGIRKRGDDPVLGAALGVDGREHVPDDFREIEGLW